MTATVFVYGTLTDPDRAGAVLPDPTFIGRARLEGCHVERGRYPTLVPGGAAVGRLLTTGRLDLLDDYEAVEDGLYVRVSVPCSDDGGVWTYVGAPDRLGVDAEWPGSGPFPDRVRRYVAETPVVVHRE